jgi:hypothetical protein
VTPALWLVAGLVAVFCVGTFLFVLCTAPKDRNR